MSNAYTNQILFGHSKTKVDAEYIQGLLPLMLTDSLMVEYRNTSNLCVSEKKDRENIETADPLTTKKNEYRESQPFERGVNRQIKQPANSIFWAIYELEHPEEAFLRGARSNANAEIDHRLKVVTELKKTPKRLKETNSKLTIEQTQSLLGSMMVSKEDKLDFCIAYAAYYNKPILVVYEKTYCLFSPMVDIDIKDEEVIILYATTTDSKQPSRILYSSEKNLTRQIICDIVDTKVMSPLKSMSNYKTQELDNIAVKLNIETKTKPESGTKEKRRKKEDIYNDIKVAIHAEHTFTNIDRFYR